jgi:uridylate kinase
MRIVFDIGGSIICPDGVPDINFIRKVSGFLVSMKKKHRIIVVTGGGKMTKNYIRSARSLKPSENLLDRIGILGTRMNALVVMAALGKHAYDKVVKNKEELEHGIASGKIVILGGTVPGQTTDAVAAAAAQIFKADLILIGTNVKGVFDKDPNKYKNAKMIKKISPKDLHKMVDVKKHLAGPLTVMDPVAARILERSKIKTVLLDGRNIPNMKKAIDKKDFVGTIIE